MRQLAASMMLLASSIAVSAASECQIRASQAYVKAVVSHSAQDADRVPMDDNVVRFEGPPGFQIESAKGINDMRKSLISGPSSFTVYKSYNEKYSQFNSTSVEAIYYIYVGLLDGTIPLTTAKVEEYFDFDAPDACNIRYINATFFIGQK